MANTGLLRTYCGIWSQEMGGLKPSAGAALVKGVPRMVGKSCDTAMGGELRIRIVSAAAEQS